MAKVMYDRTVAKKVKNQYAEKEYKEKNMVQHRNYGQVPNYVKKFNQQRENIEVMRMLEEEKAKIPPGTRLMPEQERLDTLKDLMESKRELNTALEKLPVVSKTIAMQRHRKDLEDKLTRIENAVETF